MVENREVYMTRMCEIESSSKKCTGFMFWEIKLWKNTNPSKSYFCTWKNFPTSENSSPNMSNCLSGPQWVNSPTCDTKRLIKNQKNKEKKRHYIDHTTHPFDPTYTPPSLCKVTPPKSDPFFKPIFF